MPVFAFITLGSDPVVKKSLCYSALFYPGKTIPCRYFKPTPYRRPVSGKQKFNNPDKPANRISKQYKVIF